MERLNGIRMERWVMRLPKWRVAVQRWIRMHSDYCYCSVLRDVHSIYHFRTIRLHHKSMHCSPLLITCVTSSRSDRFLSFVGERYSVDLRTISVVRLLT